MTSWETCFNQKRNTFHFTVQSVTEWIQGWKRNNWDRDIKNKELWIEMDRELALHRGKKGNESERDEGGKWQKGGQGDGARMVIKSKRDKEGSEVKREMKRSFVEVPYIN